MMQQHGFGIPGSCPLTDTNRAHCFALFPEENPHPVMRFDKDGELLYANPAARSLVDHFTALTGLALPGCRDLVRRALEAGAVLDTEIECLDRIYLLSAVPICANGYVNIYGREITQLKQAEERLLEAKREAEKANTAKSTFLANMSHEIRTPLGGIVGMLRLASQEDIPPRARLFLQHAQQSSTGLLAILNSILDFSKLESGKLALENRAFSLGLCLQLTMNPFEVLAREKGLEFEVSTDPGVPDALAGDDARLCQVLANITGNAVKFTERGRIAVTIGLGEVQPAGDAAALLFTVRDDGPGIPEDQLEAIFESYVQVPTQARLRHGGTGLGLAITRNLVESMGGRIWVQSAVGVGSTFSFVLPFAVDTTERKPDIKASCPSSGGGRLRVLLVEDNAVNQLYMREMLRMMKHSVVTAENGREALELLAGGGRFDLVLMDVLMPEMDGLETVRRIRSGETGEPDIPVVALTAHALRGDRENLLAAGMDDYMAKPVDTEEFQAMLGRIRLRK